MNKSSASVRILSFEDAYYAIIPRFDADRWYDAAELHHLPLAGDAPGPMRRMSFSLLGEILVTGEAAFVGRDVVMAASRREVRRRAELQAFIVRLATYKPAAAAAPLHTPGAGVSNFDAEPGGNSDASVV